MKVPFASSLFAVAVLATALGACTYRVAWDDQEAARPATSGADGAPGNPGRGTVTGDDASTLRTDVDRGKELLVADSTVVRDAGDLWSFRATMDLLAGDPARTPEFAEAWLRLFSATRPGVDRLLVEPWRTLSGCAAGYGSATPCELDLDRAPFQLLAIVNRIDLAEQACAPGGEIRFVYAAMDPATRAPLDATFIFEFPVLGHDAGEVAAAWHALGEHSFGHDYTAALHDLTSTLLAGSDGSRAHLRSNELTFAPAADPVWELRDFVVQGQGATRALVQNALVDTPDVSWDGTPVLSQWVTSNEASVLAGRQLLPTELRGTTARLASATFGWSVPAVADAARQAFSAGTCNGCHGGDRIVNGAKLSVDRLPFQQIAAAVVPGSYYGEGEGTTKVSTYLDEGNGGADELDRRARILLQLASTDCAQSPTEPPRYGLHRHDH